MVRVKDDGVGIPTDMVETIFELFVQSRRTLDRSAVDSASVSRS